MSGFMGGVGKNIFAGLVEHVARNPQNLTQAIKGGASLMGRKVTQQSGTAAAQTLFNSTTKQIPRTLGNELNKAFSVLPEAKQTEFVSKLGNTAVKMERLNLYSKMGLENPQRLREATLASEAAVAETASSMQSLMQEHIETLNEAGVNELFGKMLLCEGEAAKINDLRSALASLPQGSAAHQVIRNQLREAMSQRDEQISELVDSIGSIFKQSVEKEGKTMFEEFHNQKEKSEDSKGANQTGDASRFFNSTVWKMVLSPTIVAALYYVVEQGSEHYNDSVGKMWEGAKNEVAKMAPQSTPELKEAWVNIAEANFNYNCLDLMINSNKMKELEVVDPALYKQIKGDLAAMQAMNEQLLADFQALETTFEPHAHKEIHDKLVADLAGIANQRLAVLELVQKGQGFLNIHKEKNTLMGEASSYFRDLKAIARSLTPMELNEVKKLKQDYDQLAGASLNEISSLKVVVKELANIHHIHGLGKSSPLNDLI